MCSDGAGLSQEVQAGCVRRACTLIGPGTCCTTIHTHTILEISQESELATPRIVQLQRGTITPQATRPSSSAVCTSYSTGYQTLLLSPCAHLTAQATRPSSSARVHNHLTAQVTRPSSSVVHTPSLQHSGEPSYTIYTYGVLYTHIDKYMQCLA